MSEVKPPAGDDNPGGPTWSDEGDEAPRPAPVVDTHTLFKLKTEAEKQRAAIEEKKALLEADAERRRHFMRMQIRVLFGVGLVFLVTLMVLVVGLWRDLLPLEVATELMRMVIPTVLGAGLTIVGMFFRGGSGGQS